MKEETTSMRIEEELEEFFNMENYLMCIADLKGNFIKVNSTFEKVLGYTKEEILNQPYVNLVHPDDKERTANLVANELASGTRIISFENRYRCKDGTYKWISWTGHPDVKKGVSYSIAYDITERKQAESESRRHRYFLEKAQEISKIGTWELDAVKNMLVWTEQNYRNFELPAGTPLTYQTFINCVHPDDRDYVNAEWTAALKGKPYDIEHRVVANGKVKWVREKADMVFDEHGTCLSAIGFTQDITDRKQAEEEVVRSQENYRFQFMNMNSYNSLYEVITDRDGRPYDFRFIMVNHAYEKYVGKKAHELIGKTLLEVFPATEQYWIDQLAEVALTGVPNHFENFSQVMNTYTEINLYIPQKGQLAMTTANIDGRKKAEEKLRENEQRFRIAMQHLPGMIWVVDKDLVFTLSQGDSLKKRGLKPDQVVGMSLYTFFATKDSSHQSISSHLRCLAGEIVTYEQTYNDTVFRSILNPLFDRDGVVKHVLGLAIDVTAEKRAVAEEEKMRNEVNMIQKLESLGLLAGGIAHDFNNLLGGIYGYMDLAGELATDLKLRQYISKAMNTIERGRHLTQQLLTFAKGGTPVKSAAHLFPHLREIAQFALSGSNVSCSFAIPENLHMCSFDKNQIAQVIDNIIINAKQSMPVGGLIEVSARNITFTQRQHASLERGEYVQISIHDHGIGMPKEILTRIFDPFYTTKATGHGLGLATCHSIIKRHGGCIDVESEPGKGSTFHVYLPATATVSDFSETELQSQHRGDGTFLLMDDEEVIRESVAGMLISFGYKVLTTVDGYETLDILTAEIAAKRKITALLLDLTIPGGMGGKETINEIRKINDAIPVFVVSGYAEDPVMANPGEFGFIASICKPFKKAELAELLNKHLLTQQ